MAFLGRNGDTVAAEYRPDDTAVNTNFEEFWSKISDRLPPNAEVAVVRIKSGVSELPLKVVYDVSGGGMSAPSDRCPD